MRNKSQMKNGTMRSGITQMVLNTSSITLACALLFHFSFGQPSIALAAEQSKGSTQSNSLNSSTGSSATAQGQTDGTAQDGADGAAQGKTKDPGEQSATQTSGTSQTSGMSDGAVGGTSTSSTRFMMPAINKSLPLLQGQVSTMSERSPIIPGSKQEIPENTKIDLVVPDGININSEISQKGDEVMVRIAKDITSNGKVIIPGGWYMRGLITEAQSQKRAGRDGYVEVEIDKLVSPDGTYELPFNAKFSTKDNKMKSVAKIVAIDSKYVAIGGIAGAELSVQLTGIPLAVASHGYSVAIGAAAGGTIGLIGALKRKGNVASLYGGDTIKLVTDGPVTLPAFDPALLPSAKPAPHLEGLDLTVKDYHFSKADWGDKSARILQLDLDVANNTKQTFHFFDLQVISDHGQTYMPTPFGGLAALHQKVAPGASGTGKVVFTVGSPKRKYYLIFISRRTGKELTRVAIN